MQLKNKRLLFPLLAIVALTSFVIGMMISSGLKITPDTTAIEKDSAEGGGGSPINNSQVFVNLAEKLMPATVNISTTKIVKRRKRSYHQPFREGDPFRDFFGDEFFDRFFGQMPQRDYKLRSLGSGFIIDEEGKTRLD